MSADEPARWTDWLQVHLRAVAEFCRSEATTAYTEWFLAGASSHLGYAPPESYPDWLKDFVRWQRPRPRQCFYNAQKMATEYPDQCQYWEGWTNAGGLGIPVEHAWNVVPGLGVVDVTLVASAAVLSREGIKRKAPVEYFGRHVPTEFVLSEIVRVEVWSPRMDDHFCQTTGRPPATAGAAERRQSQGSKRNERRRKRGGSGGRPA